MLLRALVISCFIILLVQPLCGQEYSYVNYNTREGLAGSKVYCMVQDHDGFMWFGTETGLSRFDGTRFSNYTTSEGLPDNDIIKLYVDSKNRVWIIPFKNELCYYWRGKFYTAENDSLLKRIKLRTEAVAIKENANGDLLILDLRQVIIVKPDGTITTFDQYGNQPIVTTFCATVKDEYSFRVAASLTAGFYIFEVRNNNLLPQWFLPKANPVYSMYYPYYLSAGLEIYIGFDSMFYYFPKENRRVSNPVPKGFISISVINDSIIAVNSTAASFYNLKTNQTEQVLFKGINVSVVYRDIEDNLWFTTLSEGVYRIASSQFKNYRCRADDANLPVLSLKKQNDKLLAGTSQYSIWTFDTKSGNASSQRIAEETFIGRIMTLNFLPGGKLLAGTDIGLFKIAGEKIVAQSWRFAVKAEHIDADTVLIASNLGIFAIDPQNLSITDTVWNGRVTSLYKKGDVLYIGTLNGLFIMKGQQPASFAGEIHTALRSKISGIQADNDGVIWVTTNGFGVIGFRDEKVIAWLRKGQGMTSDICRYLFVAGDTLWVGTDQGLNRAIKSDSGYEVTRYTTADGLISNTINTILVEGDTVYTGTPEGISVFEQSKVSTNSMCVLEITGIHSPKKSWQFDTSGFHLGHWENDLRFEFAGISFKSAGEITYRYRLKGLNDVWQETRDNFLSYLSLPSGTYELEMVAVNKFGVTSKTVQIRFTIAKLLWEKPWFWILAAILFGILIWRYFQYRIQKVKKEELAKAATNRKITELEQMALKAQMNPHFIFNCLHSIQQFVIEKDTRGANKFITDFARLIRLTLDISAQPKISLSEEMNYISTYLELEKSKYEGKFDYSVEKSGEVDDNTCQVPAMILQPYVENSIRHGIYYREDNNGLIDILFTIEGKYLVCNIVDNGVGRKAAKLFKGEQMQGYQSKGLTLTSKRIELLNGATHLPILANIEDVQENGKVSGTRVIIRFPLEEA